MHYKYKLLLISFKLIYKKILNMFTRINSTLINHFVMYIKVLFLWKTSILAPPPQI